MPYGLVVFVINGVIVISGYLMGAISLLFLNGLYVHSQTSLFDKITGLVVLAVYLYTCVTINLFMVKERKKRTAAIFYVTFLGLAAVWFGGFSKLLPY